MTARKIYTFRLNDATPDDHIGRVGEITYRDGYLYYHDGATAGGELINGGGSGGGGPTSWSSVTGKPSFAAVATSGSYADLTGKPTLTTGPAGNDGAAGAQGPQGEPGAAGADGAPGQGVPTGGTAGQVLAKIDSTDYSTEWVDQATTSVFNTGTTRSISGEYGVSDSSGTTVVAGGTGTGTNMFYWGSDGSIADCTALIDALASSLGITVAGLIGTNVSSPNMVGGATIVGIGYTDRGIGIYSPVCWISREITSSTSGLARFSGGLTFQDNTVQTTAYTGEPDHEAYEITNTSASGTTYSVSVGTDGVVTMTTARGGIEFGAMPEPGGPTHFHIMRPAGDNGTDLYFGDDYNYVLQRPTAYGGAPAYGVEIGANDNSGGSQQVWRFGTDGTLTLPSGGAVDGNFVNGQWLDVWLTAPEGATKTAGVRDFFGKTVAYANEDSFIIQTNRAVSTRSWIFGEDGTLQLPTGGQVNFTYGAIRQPDANSDLIVSSGRGIKISTDEDADQWTFDTNGNLTLPAGGDIKDSTGTSVLGGGTTLPADASGYLVNDGTGALSWAAGDGTFSGDYDDLTNKPTIPADVSDLTDTTNLLFSGSYNDLSNTPALFDGDYTNLTNTPALFDGDYTSLANTPSLFSGDYDDLTSKPTLFDGAYSSLTGTPALFSGSYTDLTDKPTIPTSFSSLVNGSFTASLDSNGELSLPTNAYTEAVIKELSATALVLFAQSTGGNIKLLAGATSAGSAKQWLFNGTDGKLTAPGNLQVDGGKIILNSAGNAYVESVDYGVNSANSAVNIFGGPYQKIKLRAGFGTEATWTFDTSGDLTAPRNIILNNPVTTVTTSVTGTVADSNGNPFTFRILKADNPQLITPFADPNFVLKWTGGDAGSAAAAAQAPGGHGVSSLVNDDGTYWNFNSWYGLGGNRPNSGTVFTVEYGVVDSDTTISTTDTNLIIEADTEQWKFGTDGALTLPSGGTISEGGGLTGAIRLTPAGGANEYQALVIYPTGTGDGDHIHLTAGGGTTELYLGNDNQYVKVGKGAGYNGTIVIAATGWPNTVAGIISSGGDWAVVPLSNLATTGGTGTGLTVTVTQVAGVATAIAIESFPMEGYTVNDTITVTSGGATATFTIGVLAPQWIFAPDGDLYIPTGKTIRDTVTGNDIRSYAPTVPANWESPAPTTIAEALDRIAAKLLTLGGDLP